MKKIIVGRVLSVVLCVALVATCLVGATAKAEAVAGQKTVLFDSANYNNSIADQSEEIKAYYDNHDKENLALNFDKLNGGNITASNRVSYIFKAESKTDFSFVEKYIKESINAIEAAADVSNFHFEVFTSSDTRNWKQIDTAGKFTEISTGTAPTRISRTYNLYLDGNAKYVKIQFPHKRSYAAELTAAGSSWWLGGPGNWQLELNSISYTTSADNQVNFETANYSAAIANQPESTKILYSNHENHLALDYNKLYYGEINQNNRAYYTFKAESNSSFCFTEKYIQEAVTVIESAADVGAGKFHFEVMTSTDNINWVQMDTAGSYTEKAINYNPVTFERTYNLQLSKNEKYVKIMFPHKRSYAPEMDAAKANASWAWWLGGAGNWQLEMKNICYTTSTEQNVLFDGANYAASIATQADSSRVLYEANGSNLALAFVKLNSGEINANNRAFYTFKADKGSSFSFTEKYLKETVDVIESAADVGAGKFHFEVFTSSDMVNWTQMDTTGKYTENLSGQNPINVERVYNLMLEGNAKFIKIMFPHKRSYAAELDAAKGTGNSWWLGGPGHWQLGLNKISYTPTAKAPIKPLNMNILGTQIRAKDAAGGNYLQGLRFCTEFDINDSEVVSKDGVNYTVLDYGTLVAPTNCLVTNEVTDLVIGSTNTYVKTVPAKNIFIKESDNVIYTAVIINIPKVQIERQISARGYVNCLNELTGEITTFYSSNTWTRSVKQVLDALGK